ncbi:MAG: DNA recombination protein RmuC, partial [Alistipes sp.]|nr:DNA recombination protein RmuC [Alistipes sp.]
MDTFILIAIVLLGALAAALGAAYIGLRHETKRLTAEKTKLQTARDKAAQEIRTQTAARADAENKLAAQQQSL